MIELDILRSAVRLRLAGTVPVLRQVQAREREVYTAPKVVSLACNVATWISSISPRFGVGGVGGKLKKGGLK